MAKIDTLVVEFLMNNTKFIQGADQVEKKLNNLRKIVNGLGIAAAAIFTSSQVRKFVDQAGAIDEFSRSLNINAEELQAWEGAVKRQNGTVDGFRNSIKSLTEQLNLIPLQGAGSQLAQNLGRAGIRFRNTDGSIKDAFQILRELNNRFQGLNNQQSLAFGNRLGLDEGTIRLLQKNNAELSTLIKRQKELGIYNKEQIEQATRLRRLFQDLGQVVSFLGLRLATRLAPVIEKLTNVFIDIALWVRDNERRITPFLIAIATVITARLLPAVLSFFAVFATNPAVLALTAITTALGLLIEDFMVWQRGGESAFASLYEWATRLYGNIDLLDTKFRESIIGRFLIGAYQGFKGLGNAAGEFIAGIVAPDYDYKGAYQNLLNSNNSLRDMTTPVPQTYINQTPTNNNISNRNISINRMEITSPKVDANGLRSMIETNVTPTPWSDLYQADFGM